MILYSHPFSKRSVYNEQRIKGENILDASELKWVPMCCIGESYADRVNNYDPSGIEDVFSDERVAEHLSIYNNLEAFAMIRLVFAGNHSHMERSKFAGAEQVSSVANFIKAYLQYPQYVMFDQQWLKEQVINMLKENEEDMQRRVMEALECTADEALHILSYRMKEGRLPTEVRSAESIVNGIIADSVANLYEVFMYFRLDLLSVSIFHTAIYSQLAVNLTGEDSRIIRSAGSSRTSGDTYNAIMNQEIFENAFFHGINEAFNRTSETSTSINIAESFITLLRLHSIWFSSLVSERAYPMKVESNGDIPKLKHKEDRRIAPSMYDHAPEKIIDEILENV